MNTDPFSQGFSILHRLDPRLKIALAFFFSILVASIHQFAALLLSLLVAILLVAVSRLDKTRVCKRLVMANGMSVLLWCILPFTVIGDSLTIWRSFTLSHAGVLLALQLTIKLNTLILALIALVATSNISVVGHALYALKVPEKLVYLMLMTYRYISVLEQEYRRLTRAAKIRCFKPKTDFHTYRIYGYLIGMLLVRAAIRGDLIHQAMRCRAFKGRLYCLYDFKITRSDWLAAFVGIAVVIWIGLWEWQINV